MHPEGEMILGVCVLCPLVPRTEVWQGRALGHFVRVPLDSRAEEELSCARSGSWLV